MNNVFRGCRRKEKITEHLGYVTVGWEVGGGRYEGGLVTDTEQHCVSGYFMSEVMRCSGSVGVFSCTVLTAFYPPSSELFKVTGILNESNATGS